MRGLCRLRAAAASAAGGAGAFGAASAEAHPGASTQKAAMVTWWLPQEEEGGALEEGNLEVGDQVPVTWLAFVGGNLEDQFLFQGTLSHVPRWWDGGYQRKFRRNFSSLFAATN